MAVLRAPVVTPAIDVVSLAGGLDQITPPLRRRPGTVVRAANFECAPQGGYTRIGGYERFDGQREPSSATYDIVQVQTFMNPPTVGHTITGQTSGTTAHIIAVGTAPPNSAPYMAVTLVVGIGFQLGEVVAVGGTPIGAVEARSVSISAKTHAQYLNLAADVYRELIFSVPGSGPIRGVVGYNRQGTHTVYVWRDNAAGTACLLYQSSSSGWQPVPFFREIGFSAGSPSLPADGSLLVQGGTTATIRRVVHQSGSWVAGTAAGRFIITAPSPGEFVAGAATIGTTAVTLDGPSTAITFQPGGRFEFDLGSFGPEPRLYGADGVNRGFEFDGDTVVPITIGAMPGAPKHVAVYRRHLFFSVGSSFVHSAPGQPYNWTALAGAAEYACEDTVTGFKVLPGDQTSPALLIGTRSSCKILYGATALTGTGAPLFDLVDFNQGIGCLPYGMASMDAVYLFDDRGLFQMQAAQAFGNFTQATLTQHVDPYIAEKRARFTGMMVNKDRSQLRLFFSDGSALYATIAAGKLVGVMPIQLPVSAFCLFNGELPNGDDVSYIGSQTGGMVYKIDRGSSFDGGQIEAFVTLSWNFLRSPRTLKTFCQASVELQSNHYAEFEYGWALGYYSQNIAQPTPTRYSANFTGVPFWDEVRWDEFVWDGEVLSPVEVEMDGTAENVQVTIRSFSDYVYPFTVNSIITHYKLRRLIR